MPNFVFIAAGRELAELGYRFRESLAFPSSFTVVETKMEHAVDYCLHKLPDGTDAIIARGNTANMLRAARIPVPIVTLPIKDSELIRSINTASALYPGEDSRIAYIGLEDVIRSVSEFLKTLHKEIRFFQIEDSRDIQNCIRQAKQEHIQVVIGGEYTKELAEAQGLRCVLLESTESSLKEAYDRAMEIQKGILLQKKKLQEKLILMNAISDGIVGINEKGRISLFNQAAETLFSRKETQTVGKAASTLFDTEELAIINRTLLRGDEILSHPATLANQPRLLDFRPVMIHGQSKGVIIRIQAEARENSVFPQHTGAFHNSSSLGHRSAAPVCCQSPAFLSACALSARFAPSPLPVLITGESGTGKAAFAYQIHQQSPRKDAVFLVREGALLTREDLMAANGGALCIRDVDALPSSMVPVLNQYLEQGIIAMADQSFCPLDVRIFATVTIPASNGIQNMEDCLGSRLYYNLNALTLKVPALRERPEDIWPLFSAILETICLKKPAAPKLSPSEADAGKLPHSEADASKPTLSEADASRLLSEYSWPGNIRQLQSVARRFALLASTTEDSLTASDANQISITRESLHCLKQCLEQEPGHNQISHSASQCFIPPEEAKNAPTDFSVGALSSDKNFVIHGRLVSWEELKALDQYYQGHRSLLAKQLGVSRSTLWRYFKEMEADRP